MVLSSSSVHLLLSLLLHLIVIAVKSSDVVPQMSDISNYVPSVGEELWEEHYVTSCPNIQTIIQSKIDEWTAKDPTLAPSLIRLHYMDCAVRGCDGSILLDNPSSERTAPQARGLRGFQVIDDIKNELERQCPETVSCADILSTVARDATVKVGGPFWSMSYGRKDGFISKAEEMSLVPMGYENVTYLIEFFQSKGLNMVDLVVLSGAHTIGRATCDAIQDRIFNFKATGKADPSIKPQYLDFLKRKCRWGSDYVHLDPTTPNTFDNKYYKNIQAGMSTLATDHSLKIDSRTSPLINVFAESDWLFHQQFAVSMINLGDTDILTGDDEGEIRVNCNYVNQ